jgi:hypothetical protein
MIKVIEIFDICLFPCVQERQANKISSFGFASVFV